MSQYRQGYCVVRPLCWQCQQCHDAATPRSHQRHSFAHAPSLEARSRPRRSVQLSSASPQAKQPIRGALYRRPFPPLRRSRQRAGKAQQADRPKGARSAAIHTAVPQRHAVGSARLPRRRSRAHVLLARLRSRRHRRPHLDRRAAGRLSGARAAAWRK